MAEQEKGEIDGVDEAVNEVVNEVGEKVKLCEAIKEVIVNRKSIRSTARSFNTPKSNLIRYIARFKEVAIDVSAAINDEFEFNRIVGRISSKCSVNLVWQ